MTHALPILPAVSNMRSVGDSYYETAVEKTLTLLTWEGI